MGEGRRADQRSAAIDEAAEVIVPRVHRVRVQRQGYRRAGSPEVSGLREGRARDVALSERFKQKRDDVPHVVRGVALEQFSVLQASNRCSIRAPRRRVIARAEGPRPQRRTRVPGRDPSEVGGLRMTCCAVRVEIRLAGMCVALLLRVHHQLAIAPLTTKVVHVRRQIRNFLRCEIRVAGHRRLQIRLAGAHHRPNEVPILIRGDERGVHQVRCTHLCTGEIDCVPGMQGAQDVDGAAALQFRSRRREATRIRRALRSLSAAEECGGEYYDERYASTRRQYSRHAFTSSTDDRNDPYSYSRYQRIGYFSSRISRSTSAIGVSPWPNGLFGPLFCFRSRTWMFTVRSWCFLMKATGSLLPATKWPMSSVALKYGDMASAVSKLWGVAN